MILIPYVHLLGLWLPNIKLVPNFNTNVKNNKKQYDKDGISPKSTDSIKHINPTEAVSKKKGRLEQGPSPFSQHSTKKTCCCQICFQAPQPPDYLFLWCFRAL